MTETASSNAPCSSLPWDSSFWGFPVAKIHASRMSPPEMSKALKWSRSNNIRCLYFAADGTCSETLDLAYASGFKFVDVRVEFERIPSGKIAQHTSVSEALREDLPWLKKMARESHCDTRFFKDSGFNRNKAYDLYSLWIERDLAEHDILVARSPGSNDPAGYVTCLREENSIGRIGLIAVDAHAQRQGWGGILLESALSWFKGRNCQKVLVVTQACNVRAARLYEMHGFRICDVKIWFHRWF